MAFKAVSAAVGFLENWLYLSLWKKSRENKKNLSVAYKPHKIWNDFHFYMSLFIVCHWKPFYQVFQTIPVGRNFSKLLQRETSKPVLRACMLFFKRTEAEHGNSLVKNLCVFLPDILYSEDSFQPFKGLHCPLHGAVLLMKIEGNTSTP